MKRWIWAAACLAGAVCMAAGDAELDGVEWKNGPASVDVLNTQARKGLIEAVKREKAALPPGHTLKVDFSYSHESLKLGGVHFLPVSPKGLEDGLEKHTVGGHGVVREVPWKQGKRHGLEKEYDTVRIGESAQPVTITRKETPWVDGAMQGDRVVYHDNGKIMYKTPYKKGVISGASEAFDLAGRLVKKTPHAKGVRHGELVEYWPETGGVKRTIPYAKNRINGLVRDFHENGKLKRELPVRDEMYHGIEKEFSEDGRLLNTRYWLNDKEVGEEAFKKGK